MHAGPRVRAEVADVEAPGVENQHQILRRHDRCHEVTWTVACRGTRARTSTLTRQELAHFGVRRAIAAPATEGSQEFLQCAQRA